jgi:hypothetical protein
MLNKNRPFCIRKAYRNYRSKRIPNSIYFTYSDPKKIEFQIYSKYRLDSHFILKSISSISIFVFVSYLGPFYQKCFQKYICKRIVNLRHITYFKTRKELTLKYLLSINEVNLNNVYWTKRFLKMIFIT